MTLASMPSPSDQTLNSQVDPLSPHTNLSSDHNTAHGQYEIAEIFASTPGNLDNLTLALTSEIAIFRDGILCAGLGSASSIRKQFPQPVAPGDKTFHIYPIAFSPTACAVQSTINPKIYNRCVTPILRGI